MVKRIFVDICFTSLPFCICSLNPWVLFSGVGVSFWMSPSASWAPGVFVSQALPWSEFLVFVLWRNVAGLSMLYKVNSNSNPIACSASFDLLLLHFDIPELRLQLIHWILKYQDVEFLNLQDVSCQPRHVCGMTFPFTVFDTGTMDMGSRV